jgi:quinol-cytochrome oxidoreductase complex cytochrome b subunit
MTPVNLNWNWNWGSLACMMFFASFCADVVAAMHYVADIQGAFGSVQLLWVHVVGHHGRQSEPHAVNH